MQTVGDERIFKNEISIQITQFCVILHILQI